MSNNNLLTIEPLDLQFPFELKKKISCSLFLTNKTDNKVVFKIKTTNVADYSVSPKTGVVLPRSTCEVLVTLRPQKEVPSDIQCKDKFLVQGVIASHGITAKEITREMMFSEEAGHLVENTKVSVTYVCSNMTTISNNKLLTIEPLDLQFPFELKKKIFCSLYLTNKTDSNVAFKVKTTNVANYVRPNTGVVLPRSICEVLAPSDMQCKDKFLVQGVIASHGVTAKEITREMFSKEAGHLVENTKLSVTYVYSNTTTINCSSRIKRRFFTKGFIKKFLNTFSDNSCFGVGDACHKLGKAAGKTGYIKLD